MKIDIKKVNPNAKIPTYGSEFAAGADLYALLDAPVTISPSETVMIQTGISLAIPAGYVGLIYARSGLASKKGLAPANKVGLIDPDYRGEIMVALHNHSNEAQSIDVGERIAQLVIIPYAVAEYVEADELSDTARGEGGFGST